MIKIFNTMTREKEEFKPIEAGKVKIYACGPTVYNYIHIGNARPICVFDTLRRYFEYKGFDVTFVQNFTDIDDKIINRANEEGITIKELTDKYIKEYEVDAKGLGIRPATIHPKATESMNKIIEVVSTLIEKGFAYESKGSVYFRTKAFDGYGSLSAMPLDDLESGARVDVSEEKEGALDFVLWKTAKEGEPSWSSPWGEGRPGWHIECTAMIKEHLGNLIDIHCGGQDLVFPHHENEIAQGRAYNDTNYANYWMHNGFINVDNKKMSKSLGNFFTTRDVAEKFGYEPIKFMMLQAHYRSPINYSYDVIEQCKAALERLHTCRDNMDFMLTKAIDSTEGDDEFKAELNAYIAKFEEAMDDDLNTADAIGVLFEMVREINSYLSSPKSKEIVEFIMEKFDMLCDVLGLLYDRKIENLDSRIDDLIAERQEARKQKNFDRSDEIRDMLKAEGIILEDTPQGVKWRRDN